MKEQIITKFYKKYEELYRLLLEKFDSNDSFSILNDSLFLLYYNDFKPYDSIQLISDKCDEIINIYSNDTFLFDKEYYSEMKNIISDFSCIVENEVNNINALSDMLGNVLEKHINQKETGSYYTPTDTTKFIAWNSIFVTLLNQLTKKIKAKVFSILHIEESTDIVKNGLDVFDSISLLCNELTEEEKKNIVEKIYSLKIIDPTCGSGAFIIAAIDFYKCFLSLFIGFYDYQKIISCLYGVDLEHEAIKLTKLRIILSDDKGDCDSSFSTILNSNFISQDAIVGSDYVINEPGFDWKSFGFMFDCIIGNPPYVESHGYVSEKFITHKCGNLYSYVIERSVNILKNGGVISFIVPLPFVATPRMLQAKDYLEKNSKNVFYLTYADRPGCIFSGVHQRLTIFFSEKGKNKCDIYSASYKYWYNNERESLFSKTSFVKNDFRGILPKIGNNYELSIYSKIYHLPDPFNEIFVLNGENKVYLSTRIGFWTKAFTSNVFKSNEYKELSTASLSEKYLAVAVLNSSIFYFMWVVVSDCWHITNENLKFIKYDKSKVECLDIDKIQLLVDELMIDLENNKKYIGSKQTEYEYKHKYSKKIIDQIDDLLSPIFDLSKEDTEYIKKYTEKYRLNKMEE